MKRPEVLFTIPYVQLELFTLFNAESYLQNLFARAEKAISSLQNSRLLFFETFTTTVLHELVSLATTCAMRNVTISYPVLVCDAGKGSLTATRAFWQRRGGSGELPI